MQHVDESPRTEQSTADDHDGAPWGRRVLALAVVFEVLALPAPAFAGYGGNTYGNAWITLVVCGIMAAAALIWGIWFAVSRSRRARSKAGETWPVAPTRAVATTFQPSSRPRIIAGAAPQVDVADELTKLANLRDRGALSETEFEAQKARLLANG